jgi:CheY-like chemotaxis protein
MLATKVPQDGRDLVLVVDDDEDTAESVREALDILGYASHTAPNGKVALDYLRSAPTKYRVVLLDLMMPVMDGRDFLREYRADDAISGIPVIVVTAVPDGELLRVTAADAVAFLQKPIDLAQLEDALREYC